MLCLKPEEQAELFRLHDRFHADPEIKRYLELRNRSKELLFADGYDLMATVRQWLMAVDSCDEDQRNRCEERIRYLARVPECDTLLPYEERNVRRAMWLIGVLSTYAADACLPGYKEALRAAWKTVEEWLNSYRRDHPAVQTGGGDMKGIEHTCAANGCDLVIPSGRLMCREHWRMVARPLAKEVNRSWAALKKGDFGSRRRYLLATRQAALSIAVQEERITAGQAAELEERLKVSLKLKPAAAVEEKTSDLDR